MTRVNKTMKRCNPMMITVHSKFTNSGHVQRAKLPGLPWLTTAGSATFVSRGSITIARC